MRSVLGKRPATFPACCHNTRDLYAYHVTSGHCPKGTTEKVDCWPMPEVPNNIDMTVGNLGLTDHEENLLVTFMQTLPIIRLSASSDARIVPPLKPSARITAISFRRSRI